jgi:hypothetical protein
MGMLLVQCHTKFVIPISKGEFWMNKKKWHRPKLIVGTRSNNAESVLETCKGWTAQYTQNTSANGCGYRDAKWACWWCLGMVVS